MDWEAATGKNQAALKRILLALIAMAGLAGGEHLPRRLHRACLRLLRPAESATRRLIIVAARGLTVALPPLPRAKPKLRPAIVRPRPGNVLKTGPRKPRRMLSLPLFDRLPRPVAGRRIVNRSGVPRLSVPGFGRPFPVAARRLPQPDDPIPTARLALRLEALGRALDDLPGAARRFARWRARVEGARNLPSGPPLRFRRISALRPGRPPGALRRPTHEVHEVLADLNSFALRALESPDTS